MKSSLLAVLIGSLLATPLAAQVTKEDIQKLAAAGISDDVILKFIKANGPTTPMSAQDLADLKLSGVSDRVLGVLTEGAGAPTMPPEGAPQAEVPVDLPQASYVDYAASAYTPLYSYYSSPPLDYCPPVDTYYYSPWFSYYYPSCAYPCSFWSPGFCNSWCFGFPCYSGCFYPWYGGCFSSFGFGCRSFASCYRPFGFCSRPFGSFFVASHVGFAAGHPRFPSLFAATGPTVGAFHASVLQRQTTSPRNLWSEQFPSAGSRLSAPAPSSRPTMAMPRVESRGWPNAPSHPYSHWNSPSYAPPHWSGHSPAPYSHGSGSYGHGWGSSGSGNHGGGSGHGGGGHGGGNGGGHR